MRNTLLAYIDRFRHDRRQRVMLGSVLLVLAVIVTLLVYWQLRLSGIAMTNETYCGYEEHVHTDECYEYTLICELEETGHIHDESCYEEQQVLVCGLEESEGHTHSESCYDEEGNLVCKLEESEGHTHSEACYETRTVLICGQEETPDAHVHTDECYEKTLICELEEHTHTVECLVDLTADVEDETIWSATIPELTGDLRTDIVAIANSQVGYTESTANYSLGEDGITHYGYTRYGAWYGSEYADWDSIFAAFCLDYAGIADEFSYNAGSFAWSVDLANLGYYQSADSYVPSAGDLVFVDTDLDGRADKTAIVVSVDSVFSTVTAIQGNYTVTDVDGNSTDTVAYVTYSMTATAAPVLATISEDGETVDDVTPVILGYADVTYALETTDEETAEEEVTGEVADEEEIDLEGETKEEITDEGITDETTEPEVLGSAAVLTYAGEDYTITVTYGEDALIPEGTYLVAYEYSSDSETYLQRYAESATIYGWEGEPTEDFRVFNIGLYYDGVEIEPAAEIQVSITYTAAENSDSVSVTHHDETAEPLYAVSEYSEETGTETVTFTTDGFSDYSVMLMSTGNEEDNNVTGTSSNSSTGSLYTDLNGNELTDSTVSWTASNVSYADGSFTMKLDTVFTILSMDVTSNAVYYIYLPDGFTVDSTMIDRALNGFDTTGNLAFHYYFEVDSNGDYYIKVVFDVESYVTENGGKTDVTLKGTIDYEGYMIAVKDIDDSNDEGYVIFDDSLNVKVKVDEVTHQDDDTWIQDINVSKYAASYDPKTNSITYTITVSSSLGTGKIDISDELSLYNNLSYTEDLSIDYIEVDGVTYRVYTEDEWGNKTWYDGNYGTIDYSYYTTGDNKLTVQLPALNGYTDDYAGDAFVVEYTVYFKDTAGAVSSSVVNKASGTSTKDGDTQSSESSYVTVNVDSSNVSKSGTIYTASGITNGYIIWTITYNTNNADIAGNRIVDEMLADAVNGASGVTVTSKDSSGTTTTSTADSDYTVVTDNDGNVTSIVFNAIVDTDGDGIADYNNRTYTITYQTPVSMGTTGEITNEVDVEDENGKVIDEGEGSTWINGFGSLSKSVTAGVKSSDERTRELKWTSSITIPETGISAGTTIADYLGNNSEDYKDLSYTKQWFTYTQLNALMDNLATLTVDSNTYSKTYTYGADYSIQVYGFTDVDASTGEWVDYATILANPTAYSDYVFTAWQITLINDIVGPGTVELNYSSTADITDITTTQTYYNHIYVGDLQASASYTERNPVYKTDGNGNTGDTKPTVTDGVITWKVYVSVDGLTSTSGNIVVIDTLPEDVSLESLLIQLGSSGKVVTLDSIVDGTDTYTVTYDSYNVTIEIEENADGTTNVTATIPYDVYAVAVSSSNPYLILTYTTTIDGWDTEVDADNTLETHAMNNSVYVTLNGDKYGEDEQKQTVEHKYEETGTSTDFTHDTVEKNADTSGVGVDNVLNYEVFINLEGEMLNSGENLTFTDILNDGWNENLEVDLIYNTVHFYYLYELNEVDNGNGTYDYVYYTYKYETDELTGDVTKTVASTVTVYSNVDEISTWASSNSSICIYTESDNTTKEYYYMVLADIDWDYSIENAYEYSSVVQNYTLKAEVPDCTPLLFKYSYYVVASESGSYISLSNTATLSNENNTKDSDTEYTGYNYEESKTSGTITNAGGLTVIKSGEHTSDFIPGTTFTLYKYDSDSGEWKQVIDDDTGDAIVYTTNSNGSFSVVPGTYDTDGNIDEYYTWYSPNTLYYLIETSTPSKYLLDDETKYYFYWYDASDTADPKYADMVYPSGWDTKTEVSKVTTTSGTRLNIYNSPITSFNLKKVSITDNTTPIEGAVFALYEWSDAKNDWVRIGTYVTDSKGEIVITFDETLYAFNKAYKLTEVTSAEDYNVGHYDVTEFYFWWNSSLYATHSLPDNWGDDTIADNPYAVVYDIAAQSRDVTATNTKTTTTVAVKKLWVDEWGKDVSSSTYSTTVQLYYYVLPLDSKGNPIRTNATTASNIVTIESATSGATAALFTQTFSGLNLNNADWTSLSANMDSSKVSSFASAIYDDYNDSYVEVIVAGGDQPSNMSLIVQCSGVNVTVSPSSVVETYEGVTSIYTIKYSVSNIKNALSANGITSASSVTGICLAGAGYGGNGLVRSISVVAPMDVGYTSGTIASSNNYDGTYSSWHGYLWGQTGAIPSLETDGAIIRITYSYTSGSDVSIGIRFNNSEAAEDNITLYKTFSSTSDTFLIPVSEIMSGSSLSLDDFTCIYVGSNQYNNNGFVGTITSVEVLVPAASTTTTVYEIVAEDDSEIKLTVGTDAYADWMRAFQDYGYANSTLKSCLSTSGAVIRVYYTNSLSSSSTLGALIQSYYKDGDNTITQGCLTASTATIGTGSSYVDFYVDSFTADSVFSWDYFNCVYLYGYDGVTVTDVQILTPYVIEAGISPAGSSTVTLYHPTTWCYTGAMTNGNWVYNYISDYDGEPDYVVGELADDENGRVYTGYGFLDAIYSDSATDVKITLSGVSITGGESTGILTTDLKKLALIVQGDASVGTNGYGAMCTVYPSYVEENKEDETYTLYYSTSEMTTALSAGNHESAADACADYNGLVLALGIDDSSFTATLTDLKVTGTVADFYSESALESNYYGYGGKPYTTTDVNGNEVTYTYTLNEANDWSVSIAGLPMSYTENGTKYAYFYYFVETAEDSETGVDTNKYNLYTTYSQIEGESGGGEIVVVNTLVENTAVTVKKEWYDQDGNQLTDGNVFETGWVTVELYYYLVDESTGNIYYDGTTEDNTTVPGSATSNLASLVGKSSNVTSYFAGTKDINYSTNNWTYTFSKLAKYSIVGSTKYTRYYYFVETVSGASGVTEINYSQLTGVTDTNTPITISNTVGDDSVGYRLPSTGGQNERIYIFIGMTLMVLALLGCAYRNIRRIRFAAAGNDTSVREPSKPGTPSEGKCLRHQKKLSKDRNGDSRAGPKS